MTDPTAERIAALEKCLVEARDALAQLAKDVADLAVFARSFREKEEPASAACNSTNHEAE